MREVTGNLWTVEADAFVITTNGFVKKNGEGVMGRGVALQMKERYPYAPAWLGNHLLRSGNHAGRCQVIGEERCFVWFPVKYHWREDADPVLIERSLKELVYLADESGWQTIAMPRPGCGNGGLNWQDVKPLLESVLDDRFIIVECNP